MWDVLDILALAVRWVHAISSVTWIGGSVFYLVVLRPALRDAEKSGAAPGRLVSRLVALHFREWVHVSMIALLVSGAILTFDRLTEPTVSALYIGALTVKIAIAFWLFGIGTATYRKRLIERAYDGQVDQQNRGNVIIRWLRPLASPSMIVYGGLMAILLSDLLNTAFEKGIS